MIEADAERLAAQIDRDFPVIQEPTDWIWSRSVAVKVIDCVMSLRRDYRAVVEPRVRTFADRHPDVTACSQLVSMIRGYPSPTEFHKQELDMNSPGKATALVGVLEYLVEVQRRFQGGTEEARLKDWACWARPGDYLTLGVPGFGLAGFQYLRMLFGADTTKPDEHVLGYVQGVLGRPIAGNASREVQAVYAVERAGEMLGHSIRGLDVAIWRRGAGHDLAS